MSKHSIVLHLDEPWYNALSRQLKKEDMTVEEKLDEYLDAMIDQLPERVREKVSREVWEEHQAAGSLVNTSSTAQEGGGPTGTLHMAVLLRDILPLLPDGGRSFLCHRDTEEAVLAENLRQLTGTGREDFAALLNARVAAITPTPEGAEVVLTDVSPEELVRFDEAFDAHQAAEQAMRNPSIALQQGLRQPAENGQRVSVLRVTQDGQTDHLLTQGRRAMDMMCTAECLRNYLLLRGNTSLRFVQGLNTEEDIAPEVFEHCADELRQGTGRVVAAVDIDLDRGEFSVLDTVDGWETYTIRDVCTAAWYADRMSDAGRDERLDIFAEQLENKMIRCEGPEMETPTGLVM